MGVLQYADGLRVVWFWFDHGTGFGSVVIWASGCLVGLVWLTGLFTKCEGVGVWLDIAFSLLFFICLTRLFLPAPEVDILTIGKKQLFLMRFFEVVRNFFVPICSGILRFAKYYY